nr:uncharacterized protein LOC124492423 isoform X1 [Dermatophagoides farinae]XP_046911257.1 uncharacterized protein LOC124492423 isoform X1 [Dermatophagoides farinae]XP_046911258.1 uncharacterized protein LOC124492423 isoform X1 [Dermatophagoides farinae]XP_046911259.1 uncharacterized protein LOC124492423 isoform X1 [Dermatophagoides farinae]XP_046911260.1 uncharacterized protein LOC124492423 isoform X1 [Dermatophagoides farinae]
MTPPPPPPPPPPSFFQSSSYDWNHKSHHRTESSSEFDSSKLHKLTMSQKCSTIEHTKSKHYQQPYGKYSNAEFHRSCRPRSSYNFSGNTHDCNTISYHQQQHSKPKIYQQNQHSPSKYINRNNLQLVRQKSDNSECSEIRQSNSKNDQLAMFDGSKKSRCILFSQIYLITHVSITICLNKTRDMETTISETITNSLDLIIDIYLFYILVASLFFFVLLRYYAVPRFTDNLTFNELTEQTPILFGAIILGFSELAQCLIELIECVESDSMIIPVAKFCYHIAFMHFLLSQIIYNDYIGLRNIAIAHLLSTQISLWILSTSSKQVHVGQHKHCCDYKLDLRTFRIVLFNDNSSRLLGNEHDGLMKINGNHTENLIADPFQISLFILNNQFKFLTVFILLTMWFSNNQSKINFIRAKLSEEEVIRSAYLNPESKLYMFRGFMVGSIFLLSSIASIIFYDNRLIQYSASIFIQIMIIVISLTGLVVRRHQIDVNDPKYQINILKHHFIIFVTLFLVYNVSLMNIKSFFIRLITDGSSNNIMDAKTTIQMIVPILSLISSLSLIIQVTIQSYLLRLQGKKLINMTHVFSLLAIANFSLWMIDVSMIVSDRDLWPIKWQDQVHSTFENDNNNDSLKHPDDSKYLRNILNVFVPMNRYYCSLIFFHFWKLKM